MTRYVLPVELGPRRILPESLPQSGSPASEASGYDFLPSGTTPKARRMKSIVSRL